MHACSLTPHTSLCAAATARQAPRLADKRGEKEQEAHHSALSAPHPDADDRQHTAPSHSASNHWQRGPDGYSPKALAQLTQACEGNRHTGVLVWVFRACAPKEAEAPITKRLPSNCCGHDRHQAADKAPTCSGRGSPRHPVARHATGGVAAAAYILWMATWLVKMLVAPFLMRLSKKLLTVLRHCSP